ncbi:CoA-transferase family III domain-containing protein [Aspergillus stella-maris]|uniref:CoA-transferase family III domain-containing protein n=1 Tax=Aspergillus stella-maris TaxID=1810926 RepID=UPI003CCCCC81
MTYSIQTEASRALHEHLLNDSSLNIPDSFKEAAKKVEFVGDKDPFVPTPLKISESSAALNAYVATIANVISKERYGGEYRDVTVDTDVASLFLMSILLPRINGSPALENKTIQAAIHKGDIYEQGKPIRRQCTNVYKTKDGRWFHLHGSMNASHTMKMVGVPEQDVTEEEARKIYMEKVKQWDSKEIDRVANEEYRQAGVVCLTPEEFFESEHGKIMSSEPLYKLKPRPSQRKPWPETKDPSRPLAGIRVIDFSRVIAAPVISKILALLGAQVLKVTNSSLPDVSLTWVDLNTGKRDVNIDLKSPEGKATFAELVRGADVVVDGYRPGILSKLGFGAEELRKLNPTLVYARENCYGWEGPLSYRSGWQQVSDCLTGISWLQGRFLGLDEPIVPLLPNSDYQMGLVGAAAVSHALLLRSQSEQTFDIDVSLTQYNIWYYRLGLQSPEIQRSLREKHADLKLRHYDEMLSLITKTYATLRKVRPELFSREEYFEKMSGEEWGVDGNIEILTGPFKIKGSDLRYDVPSGARGRSEAKWVS